MHTFPLVSKVKLNRARSAFFSGDNIPCGLVSDSILRSWQRSLAHGVQMEKDCSAIPSLTIKELERLTDKNRNLLDQSVPVMENLYEQIRDTSSMVVLADAAGVILHSMGDADFAGRTRKVSLQPGGNWSEQMRGTNAIGTALTEQLPTLVHSSEHFLASNNFLSCSASPIFDPYGKLLGALDVSGDSRSHQQHTLALVRISAQQIENQMFTTGFDEDVILQFHNRPEFIGTMYEAIAVFGQDGLLLAANRSALLHLGLDRYRAGSMTFGSLFDLNFESLSAGAGNSPMPVLQIPFHNGLKVFGRVRVSPSKRVRVVHHDSQQSAANRYLGHHEAEQRPLELDALEFGDSRMQSAIDKARKVQGHDIPVLIEGESGTGKELFAKAMHLAGARRSAPFVALNCAAIPENLIESELFGYQEGAFTGARRKGNIGKIRQANGGTLFLDEIGDMPLLLQARLLRVLQERVVTPLGDAESYRIDITVICATNKKLRNEIALGRFREDLYYRLNGMVMVLPSLREREDLRPLALSILKRLSGVGRRTRLNDEVLEIFAAHPWPGNIRQMHNVLRSALVLVGSEAEISKEHLPEDFLDQFREAMPAANKEGKSSSATAALDRTESLDSLEAEAIRQAVADCGSNMSAAARRLGISRNTLYRKLRQLGW
jgi:sigma-54 dependent transcriptional regulator, acetoin dehydrogenase operon transcriptional activator AcoR